MTEKTPLTPSRIFWFWLPLAAMWLMMAIEHPMVAAVIARLPKPEPNLAIFGVTFSLALIIESPIIMLLMAGTALARGKHSYERLLCFTHILAAGLTALHLMIGLTPLYRLIMGNLIGVPTGILEASRVTFLLMTPWTAAIAYRRLWQGVLIRFHRTGVVPLTIISRLLAGGMVLAVGLLIRRFRGADLGAIALSVGVTAAAITAYFFVRSTVHTHLSKPSSGDEPLAWGALLEFYVPLALTSLINLVGRPLLVMGIARAAQPLASLAVWPVIMGVLFVARSPAFSYQEVVVALIGDKPSFEGLRRFTIGLALALTGSFILVILTPAARIFYQSISGLSSELVSFVITPTLILSVIPGMEVLISWRCGLLVYVKHTRTITQAVGLNVVVLSTLILSAGALLPRAPGTIIAAIALTVAIAAQW
ncbi:MAG: hypothetical protein GTO13_21060, partial [Proteobacteria bacterium]|nr:hypothetical protein [Pseudomonadota bacterium]